MNIFWYRKALSNYFLLLCLCTWCHYLYISRWLSITFLYRTSSGLTSERGHHNHNMEGEIYFYFCHQRDRYHPTPEDQKYFKCFQRKVHSLFCLFLDCKSFWPVDADVISGQEYWVILRILSKGPVYPPKTHKSKWVGNPDWQRNNTLLITFINSFKWRFGWFVEQIPFSLWDILVSLWLCPTAVRWVRPKGWKSRLFI